MSQLALFDLLVEWQPIMLPASPAEHGKVAWKAFIKTWRCRDCGSSAHLDQGGASGGDGFLVCDSCADIDGCYNFKSGWHLSHWGTRHTLDEHEHGVHEREKRRAKYRDSLPESE